MLVAENYFDDSGYMETIKKLKKEIEGLKLITAVCNYAIKPVSREQIIKGIKRYITVSKDTEFIYERIADEILSNK